MVKYTAAKFWVALIYAVLSTASLLALPGWWGKAVAIAFAFVGTVNVYLKANEYKGVYTGEQESPAVHNGQ